MADSNSVPIGTIIMWGGTNNYPGGWLLCDGRACSQSEYLELFQVIQHHFGSPPRSAAFDPATQFYLPDLRGQFVRGVDSTSDGSRDPDRQTRIDAVTGQVIGPQVGSRQGDQFKSHTHEFEKIGVVKGGLAANQYWTNSPAPTSATGGAETRPINVYLNFLIRAK